MRLKKTIYSLFVLLLFVPLIQLNEVFPETELDGYYEEKDVKMPALSLPNLRKNKYQNASDQSWNEEIGLKNWLIKTNNQVNYTFFNSTDAHAIIGEENHLYDETYIKSYLGADFEGDKKIEEFVDKIKYVQDTLTRLNKLFVFLLAPGKPAILPEYIPNRYKEIYPPTKTNYEAFISYAKANGINVFDARKILLNRKLHDPYPLFPKCGLHWSGHSVAHLSDTLIEYLNAFGTYRLPNIKLKAGEETVEDYRFTDYDIGEAMNLLFFTSNEMLHYPSVNFEGVNTQKPKFLGVGDSFLQSFYGFYPVLDSCFDANGSMIWYYNKQLDWPILNTHGAIKSQWLDLEIEINQKDIFILESTDQNLKMFGFGFIDRLYEHFTEGSPVNTATQALFDKIRQEEELNEIATAYHSMVGYTKEQMVSSLAKNKLRNKWLIDFDFDYELWLATESIKMEEGWLNQVKEKAIKSGISLDSAIYLDAIWVVNSKLGLN